MSLSASSAICEILKMAKARIMVEIFSDSNMQYAPRFETKELSRNLTPGKPFVWKPPNLHYLRPTESKPLISVVSKPFAISAKSTNSITYGPFSSTIDFKKAPMGGRAVCTVQTFRNAMSGPMLFMFIKHHLAVGWTVIVFDRYGWHEEVVKEFLDTDEAVIYYPYTLLEFYFPDRYNMVSAKLQVSATTGC